jgi:hypothetical protein
VLGLLPERNITIIANYSSCDAIQCYTSLCVPQLSIVDAPQQSIVDAKRMLPTRTHAPLHCMCNTIWHVPCTFHQYCRLQPLQPKDSFVISQAPAHDGKPRLMMYCCPSAPSITPTPAQLTSTQFTRMVSILVRACVPAPAAPRDLSYLRPGRLHGWRNGQRRRERRRRLCRRRARPRHRVSLRLGVRGAIGCRRVLAPLVAEAGARVVHRAHRAPRDLVRVRPVGVPRDRRGRRAGDAQTLRCVTVKVTGKNRVG